MVCLKEKKNTISLEWIAQIVYDNNENNNEIEIAHVKHWPRLKASFRNFPFLAHKIYPAVWSANVFMNEILFIPFYDVHSGGVLRLNLNERERKQCTFHYQNG